MAAPHTRHDWRVNPLEAIRSWPATLTARCAHHGCTATRQVGPRGWTIRPTRIDRWPAITFDAPATDDAKQLTLTGS